MIVSCEKDESGVLYVECLECLEIVFCEVKIVNGFFLNLVLIGYWDVWLFFKIGLRSCGLIEILIVNMCKEDRVYVDEVYAVGFVLCIFVFNDVFEIYDLFLKLLMDDFC